MTGTVSSSDVGPSAGADGHQPRGRRPATGTGPSDRCTDDARIRGPPDTSAGRHRFGPCLPAPARAQPTLRRVWPMDRNIRVQVWAGLAMLVLCLLIGAVEGTTVLRAGSGAWFVPWLGAF